MLLSVYSRVVQLYIKYVYSFPYSFPKWEFLDTCKPVTQINNTLYKMEMRRFEMLNIKNQNINGLSRVMEPPES